MLNVISFENLEEKFARLKDFNPETETWVVADLYSKNLIQNELLKRVKCLPEDAVLRVSELWQKILHRAFTDIEVASTQFISTLLGEWLKKRELPWARHPGTPQILLKYLGEFLPILLQEDSVQQTRDWLRTNPDALMRWGNWFELTNEVWQHFCDEKVLAAPWVNAYLSSQEWHSKAWTRSLYFDAGADLVGVEIDVLQKLARNLNVNVFAPSIAWREKFGATLWPYDVLAGRALNFNKKEMLQAGVNVGVAEAVTCFRYTTQIAEVKAATAQVRTWLDAGVAPNEIAVLAADIENYWPVLEAYLQREGVPYNKNVVLSAISIPNVVKWLSRLKIESREIETGALESTLFQGFQTPPLKYDRFHQLFNRIYDEDDLNRDKNISELFEFRFTEHDLLTREQFFTWAAEFWQDELTGLERISEVFLVECPSSARLELRSWLSYLCGLVAKIEMQSREGDSNGVNVTALDAAQSLQVKKAILLGLSEESLKKKFDLSVSFGDVQKIALDLGIYLKAPDQDYEEYLAESFLTQVSDESLLYFAATDFSGQSQAPSLFWLRYAMQKKTDVEAFDMPGVTRWDEIQQADFDDMGHAELQTAVLQDLGLQPPDKIIPVASVRFSASQIEKYLKCPFIFTAEKLFHLSDLPDVDLDVDGMTRGRILHAVLERLLEAPLVFERSDDELAEIVDNVRTAIGFAIADERLWPAQRQHYIRTARDFLLFEKEWRDEFTATTTVERELQVKGQWTVNANSTLEVSGRIDRVDKNSTANEYVVIDYKSSAAKLHSYGSWLSKDELQLAFYAMAIEDGLTTLPAGPVVGAFYYVLSKINREKGMRLKDTSTQLFAENNRNRSAIDAAGWEKLKSDVRTKISEVANKIKAGELNPMPRDSKDCAECNWRSACRAPHLN